jgi:hypothetical protein
MFLRALLLAVPVTIALVGAATAQNVRLLGDFRDWSSYAASDGTGAVCFAMTKPKTVAPQPDGYAEGGLYITHRPGESIKNEFNLVAGFTFQPDSTATVNVSGQVFNLFTQNDAAWLDDAGQADALASAIRAGSTMVVEGTSAAGIKIVETFSLSGATAASQAIGGEC